MGLVTDASVQGFHEVNGLSAEIHTSEPQSPTPVIGLNSQASGTRHQEPPSSTPASLQVEQATGQTPAQTERTKALLLRALQRAVASAGHFVGPEAGAEEHYVEEVQQASLNIPPTLLEELEEELPLPSLGTIMHGLGTCHPCHYVFSKQGCRLGKRCGKCHYVHYRHKGRPKAPAERSSPAAGSSGQAGRG
mmetsp:Transcript_65992/g.159506  ORF Transcript_65992/g.159506 Transcript_65992/m.159506 type:complete len:192 (+) Transcript_65992:92-667(+)